MPCSCRVVDRRRDLAEPLHDEVVAEPLRMALQDVRAASRRATYSMTSQSSPCVVLAQVVEVDEMRMLEVQALADAAELDVLVAERGT